MIDRRLPRRTRVLALALALLAVTESLIGSVACQAAQTTSNITIAAIAIGRLYVVGTTERPHTTVSLDSGFTTESDDAGKFQYELIYHPARCIVAAQIDGKIHEAVVSNCGQQEATRPAAATACTPVAAPANPPKPGGSKGSDATAVPVRTGTLLAPSAGSHELKARRPAPQTINRVKRGPTLAHAPLHRTAPPRAHRPAIRAKIERQEPDESETFSED